MSGGYETFASNGICAIMSLTKIIVICIKPQLQILYSESLSKLNSLAATNTNANANINVGSKPIHQALVLPSMSWRIPRDITRDPVLAFTNGSCVHFISLHQNQNQQKNIQYQKQLNNVKNPNSSFFDYNQISNEAYGYISEGMQVLSASAGVNTNSKSTAINDAGKFIYGHKKE